ncbi:MAG: chromosomal replication initiator protein DnaA [Planctomycetes bacterium]|nr:chromosomal replication initiator protein DnaA [Planctomycetota bacterium]
MRPERAYLGNVLHNLAGNVRREQLETWFRSLDVVRLDSGEVEFSVTSQFVRDWLQRNFLAPLQQAVVAAAGGASQRVVLSYREEDGWDSLRFAGLDGPGGSSTASLAAGAMPSGSVATGAGGSGRSHPIRSDSGHESFGAGPDGSNADGSLRAAHGPAESEHEYRREPAVPARLRRSSPDVGSPDGSSRAGRGPVAAGPRLNPNYTFDKFVVGSCNRLAHASAIAIAENPGFAYNPLFVHGNVGLGKSHLLQAICHTIVRHSPEARVIYMSCEDFTNAFIQAIQDKEVESFRQHYRDADVLVIDDVQFLAHKEKTQDEFFHTFNSLYDNQKQIVLSSDRPPVEIPTIEERLVSRFKWGLVAEVEAPCFDTRKAIVQRKAMGRGTELPDEVASFLAERVATNIRELEGAVIKVVGIAAITGQPITLGLAETCMRGLPVRNGQVSADDVMNLITSEFAISARELTGKSRTQMVSLPRQVAMYLIREHTENSLEDVGRIFGGRDHTTVLYAVNKIKERLQRDRTFKDLIESLSNRLLTRGLR